MSSSAPTVGLWYDFRNPARWRQASGRLYRETIDQADHVIPQVNARLKNRLAPV